MSLTQIITNRVIWTHLPNPTSADMQALSQQYPQFHPLNLQDCLTELEYPKLDQHDHYVFLVVQVPVYDERLRVSRPHEVDIFIAKGTLVTAHQGPLPTLEALFELAQTDDDAREKLMGRGASPLLYDLLNALIGDYEPFLRRVKHQMRHLQNNLFASNTRHLLHEMALLRRDVIALRSIVQPQTGVMQALENGQWPFIHDDLDLYWGDLQDSLQQYQARFTEYAEVAAALAETLDTLASHRIDDVVRVLTVFTVLTLPLTLVSTVFSMNVALPFERHPGMFFLVLGFGISLTVALFGYLRHRRWM